MEYLKTVIGGIEMYIPANDKLGEMIITAYKRLNYQKRIAKMRNAYSGEINSKVVVIDSDFFYALEDVMAEKGYDGVIHHQFEQSSKEQAKVLYALFREDKTMRYLIFVCGYEQEQVQNIIRNFFESLKKIIF